MTPKPATTLRRRKVPRGTYLGKTGKWRCRISVDGKMTTYGPFPDAESASRHYAALLIARKAMKLARKEAP